MSVELVTFDGGNLSPKRDAVWRKNTQVDGVIYGCELTHLGSNQVQISAGWLNVRGRLVEVLQETILCELATTGTMDGRIYLKLDLADATTPAELLTVAATTLPDLEQDDDFNVTNGVWEMELGTYTASTTVISDLYSTYNSLEVVERAIVGGGMLINGNFDVWQEDTSFVVGASEIYTSDQWLSVGNAAVSRIASTNANTSAKYSLQMVQSGDSLIGQKIENENNLIYNKKTTLSFWVKGDSDMTAYANLCKTDRSTIIQSIKYNITTSWSKVEITFDASTSWGYNNVIYVIPFRTPSISTSTVQIEQVKLESGGIASSYIPKTYAEELMMCQRYFQIYCDLETRCFTGAVYSTTAGLVSTILPVEMRDDPTASFSGTFTLVYPGTDPTVTPAINSSRKNTVTLSVSGTSLTEGYGIILDNSGGCIKLDARI